MKNLLLTALFSMFYLISIGQGDVENLIREGVNYHDNGDYPAAIAKYDEALRLDSNNLTALSEKAYSLLLYKKYDESVATCQKAIKTHPKDAGLKNIYITYGTAYDYSHKPEDAIKTYDEGIALFPNYYLLYFNKGITLYGFGEIDKAIENIEKAMVINPKHAGSHNALGRIMQADKQKIPAIMAYCRLLSLESNTGRAKTDLEKVQKLLKGNTVKTGRRSVSINLDMSSVNDTTSDGKPKPNSFGMVEMMLSFTSALDYDRKYKKESEVERFNRKLELICEDLKDKGENSGFFWDFYAPYFAEMYEKKLVETFGYLVFASSGDKKVDKWLKAHQDKVKNFYEWSDDFEWNKE